MRDLSGAHIHTVGVSKQPWPMYSAHPYLLLLLLAHIHTHIHTHSAEQLKYAALDSHILVQLYAIVSHQAPAQPRESGGADVASAQKPRPLRTLPAAVLHTIVRPHHFYRSLAPFKPQPVSAELQERGPCAPLAPLPASARVVTAPHALASMEDAVEFLYHTGGNESITVGSNGPLDKVAARAALRKLLIKTVGHVVEFGNHPAVPVLSVTSGDRLISTDAVAKTVSAQLALSASDAASASVRRATTKECFSLFGCAPPAYQRGLPTWRSHQMLC